VALLPVPAGTQYSLVTGADRTGRFVVGFAGDFITERALVWRDGVLTELSVPLSYPRPGGVNSRGTVVGAGTGDGGRSVLWQVTNGQYTELPLVPGTVGVSGARINERGDVLLGYQGSDYNPQVAVLPVGGRVPLPLPVPEGYHAYPTGISADGTVTAQAFSGTMDGLARSFVWRPDRTRWELTGTKAGVAVVVEASAGHWAAGAQYDPATGTRPSLRWDLLTGTVQLLPAELTSVRAITDGGDVGGRTDFEPAVVRDGQLLTLPMPAGSIFGDVTALGGDTIAGNINDNQAASWTCE
jgi:hypothetical protein